MKRSNTNTRNNVYAWEHKKHKFPFNIQFAFDNIVRHGPQCYASSATIGRIKILTSQRCVLMFKAIMLNIDENFNFKGSEAKSYAKQRSPKLIIILWKTI